MGRKCLDARCATSSYVARKQIHFDDETGLILSVGECELPRERVDFYFNDDCLLFAGMGDIHIHAREDLSKKNTYKEDFHSACCAALNGGLVHLADMPNNPIPPVDDETYLKKVELSLKSEVPILMYAGIGPLTRPLSFSVPYKAYMGPSVGDLFFRNNKELEDVLKHYEGESVSFHCEDPEILEESKAGADHFKRRPLKAELLATDFALKLIEKFKLKGKLCHYSAGEGLPAINRAKSRGINVTCEVTPQHLYFSEEKIRTMEKADQIKFQMNPPIRGVADQKKLLTALMNGEIDFLATDHAPHSPLEKEQGMSGLPGLDTYAPFVTWLLLDQKVPAETIAKVASENPGAFFNQFLDVLSKKVGQYKIWGKGMGFLEAGHSASFTVLNLKRSTLITPSSLKTKAHWSPFLGETFPGSLECVFLAGKKL
ncbi:MAG: amidohydrolase family protein [Bacteriovorax sp.]